MFAQDLKQVQLKVVFQGLPKINRTIFQYIYENYLKRRSQIHGQAGMGSGLLFSVSRLGARKISSKRPYYFILLKTLVNHRYYGECPIALH